MVLFPTGRRLVRAMTSALLTLCLLTAMTAGSESQEAGHATDPAALGFAFAKASPLTIYESAELTGGKREDFKFGVPYKVIELKPNALRIVLDGGAQAYVRASHVSFVSAPRWLASTDGLSRSERPNIRMWASSMKLLEFLAGTRVRDAQWDFEEYFESPPEFKLRLPYLETDSLDLLGGKRQVKVFSVMMPISREMLTAFDQSKSGGDARHDLHLVIDVSGSTVGFLEETMEQLAQRLRQNEVLQSGLRNITLTTFGDPLARQSSYRGVLQPARIDSIKWRRTNGKPPKKSEVEPLPDALATLAAGLKGAESRHPIVLVLSGADVEISGHAVSLGGIVSIDEIDLESTSGVDAVFAQLTPEPGNSLRKASGRLKNAISSRYMEFSEHLADDIVASLLSIIREKGQAPLEPRQFVAFAKAAHADRMLAFLPRELTAGSLLPQPQPFAADADWYTIRVWVALDQLTLREEIGQ